MNFIYKFFDMGGYEIYVWSSYFITFFLLVLFLIKIIKKYKTIKKKLNKHESNLMHNRF